MKYKVGDKVTILAKSKVDTGSSFYSGRPENCIGQRGFVDEVYYEDKVSIFKSLEPKEGYMGIFLFEELRPYRGSESSTDTLTIKDLERAREVLERGTISTSRERTKPHKFKVGDKVRVIGNSIMHCFSIGYIGLITEVSLRNNYRLDNKIGGWAAENDIELVTDKPKKKFKVGDRVLSTGGFYTDQKGTIIEIGKEDTLGSVDVKFDSGDTWWKPEYHLEILKEKEPKKEFKWEWSWQPLGMNFGYSGDLYGPTRAMPWFMGTDFAIDNEEDARTPKPKGGGIMSSLTNMAKRYLSPSVRKLMKAGYITPSFNRTSQGTDALLDILWQKHEKELLDAATKQIKADKKAKKNEDSEDEE